MQKLHHILGHFEVENPFTPCTHMRLALVGRVSQKAIYSWTLVK